MGLLEDIVHNLVSNAIDGMKKPTGRAPKPSHTSDRRQMETRQHMIANRNSRNNRHLPTKGKVVKGTVDGRGTRGQRRWEAKPSGGYMSGTGWRDTSSVFAKKSGSKSDHKGKSHDFDWGRLDSVNNWRDEINDPESTLGLAVRSNSPSNLKKSFWSANEELKGWTPGDAVTNLYTDIGDTLTDPAFHYNNEDGVDVDWGDIGHMVGLSAYAMPSGGAARKPFMTLNQMGPKTWYEAGAAAPVNRQLPRGPYRMGPATDPITGVPIRFGGRVKDPRAGMEPTYSTNNIFKPFSGQGSLF